ncbi:MAG: STAS domain-containing protein [Cyanobacteria bacterium J06638_28]
MGIRGVDLRVFQLEGMLNADCTCSLQAQFLEAMSSDASPGLMIDMSRVESIDDAGLTFLLLSQRLAYALDKRFCLYSVPTSIQTIFELAQFDRVFELEVLAEQAA